MSGRSFAVCSLPVLIACAVRRGNLIDKKSLAVSGRTRRALSSRAARRSLAFSSLVQTRLEMVPCTDMLQNRRLTMLPGMTRVARTRSSRRCSEPRVPVINGAKWQLVAIRWR